ncbi:MAG: hypothetical protein SF069_05605 [Phycisphaerae bacterium]|nr:hypothetical protein [Phycisphaerae bacterium]
MLQSCEFRVQRVGVQNNAAPSPRSRPFVLRGLQLDTLHSKLATLLAALALQAGSLSAWAQLPPDWERLVQAGSVDALQSAIGTVDQPDEWQALAQACGVAARAAAGAAREALLDRGQEYLSEWLRYEEMRAAPRDAASAAALGRAALEAGNFALAERSSAALDEFELTNGQRGDRAALAGQLEKAEAFYRRAAQTVGAMLEQTAGNDENLQITGLYGELRQISLDAQFNQAWSNHFLGRLRPDFARELAQINQQNALRGFSGLVNTAGEAESGWQCRLGVAMCLRELRKHDDAAREFEQLLAASLPPQLAGQARYEAARNLIAAGRFEEARKLLKPLAATDVDKLPVSAQAIRFYANLARAWEANSYLVEAAQIEQNARGGNNAALFAQARQARETGLAMFRKLRGMGGVWPDVVQCYVGGTVRPDADPTLLSADELLALSESLIVQGKPAAARDRAAAGLQRPDAIGDTRAGLLLALASAALQNKEPAIAADAYLRVATEHARNPQAPAAALEAFRVYAGLAERTNDPQAWQAAGDAISRIVIAQPTHPEIGDLRWGQAIVLQRLERFEDAARAFSAIPASDPRAEEARFRQAHCGRMKVDSLPRETPAETRREAALACAKVFDDYAEGALSRAAAGSAAAKEWAAEATLQAAELRLSLESKQAEAAEAALREFEQTFAGDAARIARGATLRVRALQAMGKLNEAAALARRTAASDQAALPAVAALASALREEVQRLGRSEDAAGAKALAEDAAALFELLGAKAGSTAASQDAAQRARWTLARAEMLHFAGDAAQSKTLLEQCRAALPRDPMLVRLEALQLTAALVDSSSAADIEAAKAAWSKLLQESALRERSPNLYWEARLNWLRLTLRDGNKADVEKAIRNERVWYPDLGGPEWKARLEKLEAEAKK